MLSSLAGYSAMWGWLWAAEPRPDTLARLAKGMGLLLLLGLLALVPTIILLLIMASLSRRRAAAAAMCPSCGATALELLGTGDRDPARPGVYGCLECGRRFRRSTSGDRMEAEEPE